MSTNDISGFNPALASLVQIKQIGHELGVYRDDTLLGFLSHHDTEIWNRGRFNPNPQPLLLNVTQERDELRSRLQALEADKAMDAQEIAQLKRDLEGQAHTIRQQKLIREGEFQGFNQRIKHLESELDAARQPEQTDTLMRVNAELRAMLLATEDRRISAEQRAHAVQFPVEIHRPFQITAAMIEAANVIDYGRTYAQACELADGDKWLGNYDHMADVLSAAFAARPQPVTVDPHWRPNDDGASERTKS